MAWTYVQGPPYQAQSYSSLPISGLATCSIVLRMAGNSATSSYAPIFQQYLNSSAHVQVQRRAASELIQVNIDASNTWFSFSWNGVMRSVIITFDGAASPKLVAYVDGVSQTITGTVSTTALATNTAGVTSPYDFNGVIAEVAVYSRVITPAEALIHAAGYTTNHFPRGRIFCAPMIRSANDIVGGRVATTSGSPSVSDHPRIYA